MELGDTVHWAVGTTNKAKVACVEQVVARCFPKSKHIVTAVPVTSAVSAQPLSAEETQKGAEHRAHAAVNAVKGADFGVGLEGGIECIGGRWFECGWMCVYHKETGREGLGTSARFEMSGKLMKMILEDKKELAEVMDEMTGETDIRSNLGAMGVLTATILGRAEAYSHGLIFALAPFLSEKKYWE